MELVSKYTYEQIVLWVKGAVNYKGYTPHDVDGIGHCLDVNGIKTEVAWTGPDDFSDDIIYLVHKEVLHQWEEVHGYKINF